MAARSRHHPSVAIGSSTTQHSPQTVEPRLPGQPRALQSALTPMERARRSRQLGWSLLVSFLLLLVAAAFGAVPQLMRGNYVFEPLALGIFGIGLGWLGLVYLSKQFGWFETGGWLLVILTLTVLGASVFAFSGTGVFAIPGASMFATPENRVLLLPLAAIPVCLAALLLRFQAVPMVALLASSTLILTWWYALGMIVPVPATLWIPASVLVGVLVLLSLILSPLRHSIEHVVDQMQQAQRATFQLEERLTAEHQQLEGERVQQRLERRHGDEVLQQITDGVITTDADGRIVHTNGVAQQLWAELFEDELDGRNINVVIARLRNLTDDTNHPNPLTNQIDLLQVVRDDQQQGMGTTYVLLDRRERARLTRLRSELLELLAREMHDPLTSMLTALEMILGEKNLPDGTDRVLVGARRSGQRLQNLMETLREVNSLEESRDILRCTPTALRAVLESGIAQTAPLAQQNSVHVVAEYSSDAVLPIDKERLLRAFVNLLYNALRQSPPYSTVHVQTQRVGTSIVVRVTDQGPGLAPEVPGTIFARLSSAPDERSGSALGLTFSRLVVEAHSGRIWVESNGGQGSTFAFSLPLEGGKGS